nr:hypothetical protein CFP56_06021 [Quercus suber]
MDSTRLDTASLEQIRPREGAEISRNLTTANFEEQLRVIDAAILAVTPNLENPPFTDSFSDVADNTTKKVDDLNLKRMGTEEDNLTGLAAKLTSEMGLSEMGLDLEASLSHGNTMGHEVSQAHNLFSIGSYTTIHKAIKWDQDKRGDELWSEKEKTST